MALDIMSHIPALRRETSALWSFHHTLGYGLRHLRSRLRHTDTVVLGLASSTSREIRECIARKTSQLTEAKPPNAKWPDWRTRSVESITSEKVDSNSVAADHAGDEHQASNSSDVTKTQSRILKPHLSDESTVLNEGLALDPPSDDELSSMSSSSIDGNFTATAARKKGRPGRRQKAKRRQLEWEEAGRQAFAEAMHASSSSSNYAGSQAWAHEALVTVFENLLEDELDKPASRSSEDDREPMSGTLRRSEINILDEYPRAVACMPQALLEHFCSFRSAALQACLTDVESLRKLTLSLHPSVAALQEAREASKSWQCPPHLQATWNYMRTHTLEKPVGILHRLDRWYARLSAVEEDHARGLLEEFEYERDDLEHCLENSVEAFIEDIKLVQFCIDRESARHLQLAADQRAPTPRVTQACMAEREEIKNMDRDDLQSFLAQKLLGNKSVG